MSPLKKNKANLDMVMYHEGKKTTFRKYFHLLLKTLWEDGESFSGKRPFGNGGWEYDLYKGLIINNVIEGKLDEDGYVDTYDKKAAWNTIMKMINEMCGVKK